MRNKKECRRCKVSKSLSQFSKRKSSSDGLQSRCKSCWSEQYSKDAEVHSDPDSRIRVEIQVTGSSLTDISNQIVRRLVLQSLIRCKWHQKKAAALLGITYNQLRHYYRKYDLDLENPGKIRKRTVRFVLRRGED